MSTSPEKLRDFLAKGVVLCVQITPFTRGGDLDIEALRENTRFLVEKTRGKPFALIPTGSTGEFYALNDEERKKVIKTVIDEAGGKMFVIPGTMRAGARWTIELSKYAEDLGADGVMVVLSYYFAPKEEGMYKFYEEISRALDIGIIVYNNPEVSKAYIYPHLMERIAELPNVVGVKENTPHIPTLYEQIKAVGDRIPIIQGRGEWWYAATVMLGVKGFVSGYANFMPESSLELLDAGNRGDWARVRELMGELSPLEEFIAEVERRHGASTSVLAQPYVGSCMYISVIKKAMDAIGLRGGFVRSPLIDIRDDEAERLERIVFERLKLSKTS